MPKQVPTTSAEVYLEQIVKQDVERLTNVRTLKRVLRNDPTVDELDRAVLGVTGSAEKLEYYREIAAKIGKMAGQPIIKILSRQDDKVTLARAGFISGDLTVASFQFDSSSNDSEFRRTGLDSGHASLEVPVNNLVAVHKYPGEHVGVHTGDQIRGERTIKVAHLILKEWENGTMDPAEDSRVENDPATLLLGREEIYGSEYFSIGVGRALLELEKYTSQLPVEAEQA